MNRPSLLAVVAPIRRQSTPNWKNVGSVVLLDKSSFCDGNSTVATSGVNEVNIHYRMGGLWKLMKIQQAWDRIQSEVAWFSAG